MPAKARWHTQWGKVGTVMGEHVFRVQGGVLTASFRNAYKAQVEIQVLKSNPIFQYWLLL